MIVTPKDAETAQRLLAEAEKQGLPASVVVVTAAGFDVPDSLVDPPKAAPQAAPEPEQKPRPARSRRSRSTKE